MEVIMKPLLLILGMLLTTAFLQAQEFPSNQKQQAWEQFKSKEGTNWSIRWNESTGLPRVLLGTSQTKFTGEPKEIAITFLTQNKELFSFSSELKDLQYVETKTNKAVSHVKFQQYYNGIRVEGAQYKVHVRKDGKIEMANGYYYNTIDISIDPAITKQSAIITAQTDLKLTTNSKDNNKAELIIFPKEEKFYLAYQVEVFQEEPFIDWEYIVDAQTGKVLRAFSKTTSIYPMYTNVKEAVKNVPFVKPNELFVTGTGNVYPKHPNNSVVTTKNLPRLDGNGKLDGTHVRVKNSSAPDAYSATPKIL